MMGEPSGHSESPGERLHRLISAQWAGYAPVDEDGDWSALSDSAREGWADIARSFLGPTADASDLEYCVRCGRGRIVVPWRPVGEVVAAVDDVIDAAQEIARHIERESSTAEVAALAEREEAESRFRVLLGLEPPANGGDV